MDEDDFIAAMIAEPKNAVLLGVFADFLEERGDERAGLYRLLWEHSLVGVQEKFESDVGGYFIWQGNDELIFGTVCDELYGFATSNSAQRREYGRVVAERLNMASAWRDADEAMRERWREETTSIAYWRDRRLGRAATIPSPTLACT